MNDWRYSEEKMKARQSAYNVLLKKYGSHLNENGEPLYSMKSISECAHDWVSQGNVTTSGIVKYFNAYYT